MIKEISVYNKNGEVLNVFSIKLIQRKTGQLKLDTETFYKKYSGRVPDETVEMFVEESAPFTLPTLIDSKTHIHQGIDGEFYICYPMKINSLEDGLQIAINWCLLTTFHLIEYADISWFESFGDWMVFLTTVSEEIPKSFEQFPLWLQNGFPQWSVKVR